MARWMETICNVLCLVTVIIGVVCSTLDPRGPDSSRRAEFWSAESFNQPFTLRMLNRLGAWMVCRGWIPCTLASVTSLKAAAVAKTGGLSDFGDSDYEEPLEVLHTALDAEAGLTLFGRWAVGQLLVKMLEDRLLMASLLKKHPEIKEEKLAPPVFIVGFPRTGTTHLHNLMSQDNDFRPARVEMWVQDKVQDFLNPAGEIKAAHFSEAFNGSEECIFPMRMTFVTFAFMFFWRVPTYSQWYMSVGGQSKLIKAYKYYAQILRVIQWKDRQRWAEEDNHAGQPFIPRTFLLKSPAHVVQMGGLFTAFPGAKLVWNHRDPCKVIPSYTSLTCMCRTIYTDSIQTAADRAAVGADEFARLMQSNQLGMEYRKRVRAQKGAPRTGSAAQRQTIVCGDETIVVAETNQIIDNQYKEMVNNTLDNVRSLYQQLGRQLSAETEAVFAAYLGKGRQDHAYGRHVYTFEQFGLSKSEVRAATKSYVEQVGVEEEA